MEPTLDVGERVLVSRVNYRLSDPDRGDIVVFHPPEGAESNECGASHPDDQVCPRPVREQSDVNFIKRIVAVPGDTLAIRNGYAVVNGKVQRADYIRPCTPGSCDFPRPIKVPPDHFFMMGDNRGASDDSRFWGPVPEEMDHRPGLPHLLARQPNRHPLRPSRKPRRRTARRLFVFDRVLRAAASSPAPTRPGAAALPARWSPRRCCSTTSG